MIRNELLIIVFLFLVSGLFAQESIIINGTVSDSKTGESLSGASVIIENISNLGAISNSYGYYSLKIPKGIQTITYKFLGFESKSFTINCTENKVINVELSERNIELDSITVTGINRDQNVTSMDMGTVKLSMKQIEKIPVIFGERDILKIIQLTPGVKSAGEGSTGFNVRGGGIDQNLILIDEAPVYNASHLMGFFSIFNSEAIKDAILLKGFVPAEYGGRASSVLDIKMREGNLKEYNFTGNIGLIASSLTVEGPIQKDKSSFILSGRRTYADLFVKFSKDEEVRKSHLYFYDLNLKTNFKINDKNRIYFSAYKGIDDFNYKDFFGFNWGNETGTLRINHIFNSRLFSNTSFIFSNYMYNVDVSQGTSVNIVSKIKDKTLKQDFTFYLNSNNTIKFGGSVIHHNVLPGKITVEIDESKDEILEIRERNAVELALYLQNHQKATEKLSFNYGFRIGLFANVGPGDIYKFNETGKLIEKQEFDNFKILNTFKSFEPRMALNYQINNSGAVKISYTRLYQFLHLLTNSISTVPTDLWLPSSNNVYPQVVDQVSGGYFKNLFNNELETSVELYYKKLYNQIDYKNGAQLFFNSSVEAELVYGTGWAYGAEFQIKKTYGAVSGWVNYTWSKTMRQFDAINYGNPFPARHDRIHDISIVTMFDITKKWSLSATWVYNTGHAVTFPSGKYTVQGVEIAYYSERNGYRMPDYHRLDFGVTYVGKKSDKWESSWNASIYNYYARENAFFIDFRESKTRPGKIEAYQIALFKAIPSISYKFKF